ncbi:MAG: hypothetical protein KC777_23465 [Cyanobacteria bacterium HKST-UBA02]|nr:hypothetical protein [Cyanobacteria bacterium HKST-UBA02]
MQVRQCHCCGKECGQDWTFCPYTGEPVSGWQPAAPPNKGDESASAILVNLRKKVGSMGSVVPTDSLALKAELDALVARVKELEEIANLYRQARLQNDLDRELHRTRSQPAKQDPGPHHITF